MTVSRVSYPQREVCNHRLTTHYGGGNIRKKSLIFFLCLLLPVFSSCHYKEGVATDLQKDGKVSFNRIAVVPFQRISPEDDSTKAVRCPLCGSILRTEKMPQDAEKVIEDIFLERLKSQKSIQIIPPDRCGAVFDRVSAESLKALLPEILKKVGNELEAEGIIVGYVHRYRERKGYPYSAEKPASVAFEIHLVRVSDGVIVWKGIFDKTQKSLMEDILQVTSFFKGRGQWVTGKELATEGIDALLENFPGFK